jgi:hypothetical protein
VTLSWAEITRQVARKHYWAWPLITTFVTVTSFILYSLLVGVVCDAVMQDERAHSVGEKEMRIRLQSLRSSFCKLTDRQEKMTRLAMKSCSLVGLEKISFADTRIPTSDQSFDASSCCSRDSLHLEQWRGAFFDASDTSGNSDLAPVSNLELNILRKSRK